MARKLFLSVLLAALVGCAGEPAPEGETARTSPPSPPASGSGLVVAGLEFFAPEGWDTLGPTQLRQEQYRFGPLGDDAEAAEVNVFFFGAGQGGGIDANLQRWVGQMRAPEGSELKPVRSMLESEGANLHFVEVDGIFMKSMGGGPMTGGKAKPMEGYRLVGAVVDGPGGRVFFKLVGPQQTARVMETGLRAMLAGLQPVGGR